MTEWKRVRDEAAEDHGDKCLREHASHYDCCFQYHEHHRSFEAGYDYAIENDPRVKALILELKYALDGVDRRYRDIDGNGQEYEGNFSFDVIMALEGGEK